MMWQLIFKTNIFCHVEGAVFSLNGHIPLQIVSGIVFMSKFLTIRYFSICHSFLCFCQLAVAFTSAISRLLSFDHSETSAK